MKAYSAHVPHTLNLPMVTPSSDSQLEVSLTVWIVRSVLSASVNATTCPSFCVFSISSPLFLSFTPIIIENSNYGHHHGLRIRLRLPAGFRTQPSKAGAVAELRNSLRTDNTSLVTGEKTAEIPYFAVKCEEEQEDECSNPSPQTRTRSISLNLTN